MKYSLPELKVQVNLSVVSVLFKISAVLRVSHPNAVASVLITSSIVILWTTTELTFWAISTSVTVNVPLEIKVVFVS